MRVLTVSTALLLAAAAPAIAAVPNSVVVLLGPSLGHVLAQNDLCGWGMSSKIEATYRNSFTKIGLTDAQATEVWSQAHDRQAAMAKIPADGQSRMKAEMCSPAARLQFEHDLAD